MFIMAKDPVCAELTLQGPLWKIGADNELIYLKYLGLGKNRMAEMSKEGILLGVAWNLLFRRFFLFVCHRRKLIEKGFKGCKIGHGFLGHG